MVTSGWSVSITTLFSFCLGKIEQVVEQVVDQYFVQILSLVCDWAGIEIATPGSAFRYASVVRHITDCTTQPGELLHEKNQAVDSGHKKAHHLSKARFSLLA